MDLVFFLGLGAITLVVIGLVVYVGLKLNSAVNKQAPDVNFPLYITPTGSFLFACVVAFWVVCAAARVLRSGQPFGAFLNTADGIAAVLAGSVLFVAVAGAILKKFGYPIARRGGRS